ESLESQPLSGLVLNGATSSLCSAARRQREHRRSWCLACATFLRDSSDQETSGTPVDLLEGDDGEDYSARGDTSCIRGLGLVDRAGGDRAGLCRKQWCAAYPL